MRISTFALALLGPAAASAKSVFAHFMVGNTAAFAESDWRNQISLAQAAKIDAFALNMANNEETTNAQLPKAFAAAEALGFRLFFSFDYAGNGPWEAATVTSLINQRRGSKAYFTYKDKPLVSTFEGSKNGTDWVGIKLSTGCFFIPDWSSLGAKDAMLVAGGVADGLFSWDAWPNGPRSITTYPDASYFDFLKGKPYMAPVSPCFYTNLPGYDKNWLWRGDSLWVDRWNQLISGEFQSEFLQIISWNDYGESHYIGPLDDRQYTAFNTGNAPYNYVLNKPHNGWRELLPYFITLWKNGTASVTQEGVVSWYRLHPKAACNSGGTTGNTASQLQVEVAPSVMVQDEVYFAAPLGSAATVSVTIGGVAVAASWNVVPSGGVGIYSGSAPTGGRTGPVVVTLTRNGAPVVQMTGQSITTVCTNGLNNYNPWVGSKWGAPIAARSPPLAVSNMKCVKGFGANGFSGLCEWSCARGYCPEAACVCTLLGTPPVVVGTKPVGYTKSGLSPAYDGLCAFACARDYCPDTACSYTKGTTKLPSYSPFLPDACTGGYGPSPFEGLCSYGCNWGYCPMNTCTCNKFGPLNVPSGPLNTDLATASGDSGLCKFACQRDYCPSPCAVVNPLAVRFNFYGCNDTQQRIIYDTWDHLRVIGNAVDFDIDWDSQAARDFFGGQNSAEYHERINQVIRHLKTWRADGSIFAWKMEIHCDDFQRVAIDPATDCPPGTKREDYFKCKSRCWHALLTQQGQLARWIYGSGGYTQTEPGGSNMVGKTNYCPGFFALKPCPEVLEENVAKYKPGNVERIDLNNYRCRTMVAIHELMHIDSNVGAAQHYYKWHHATDRRFRIWDENLKRMVVKQAYGPQYTRTLARYTRNTGYWVITNADNLALYCVATWLTSGIGEYPRLPEVKDIDRPREDPWVLAGGVYGYNGTVYLNKDTSVIANDLNVPTDEIGSLWDTKPLGCSDAPNNGSDICTDDANNPVIDLVGPLLSTTPKPVDFNCNCGENGCSSDSMPCCANGSCACHCNENGCAEQDPTCCYNGSCAPLPGKKMRRMGKL